ncbi:hypothetical protein BHM03_00030372 [Ensete ventricosum]|nr:hypothetical protein BHM03_00030372 [Ensete ventricosum]
MLHPGVTQEWVGEGELPRKRTKKSEMAEALRGVSRGHTWRSRTPEFITQESVCNGDVTRRRHGTADRCGIVRSNTIHAVVSSEGHNHAEENRIGASPATRWRRPCMRVVVCLSIDQRGLLGGHSGVEADSRKGRGSDDESSGAQLPKSKASVRKEVHSEEHHSAAEENLLIAKEGIQMQGNR